MTDTWELATPATAVTVRLRARVRMIWSGSVLLLQLGNRDVRLPGFDEARVAELHGLRAGRPLPQVQATPWMATLLQGGFLEEVAPPSQDPDLARFDRLLNYLSEFETAEVDRFALLQRLRESHLLLVGLGGLASWVVYNLLCCGVGGFTLVDGDRVEASNLNRSILYTENDIGRPKVQAAAEGMRRFAPRTEVRGERMFVAGPQDLRALARDADLVVGMADQPPWLVREWIAAAAVAEGKPVVQGSGSRVGPFRDGPGTSCSVCDWSHQVDRRPQYGELLARQARLPRGDSGALSAVGSVTAGILGLEIVRHLLGLEPRTRNRVWEFRGDLTSGFTECLPHPRCGVCGAKDAAAVPTPSQSVAAG